MKKLNFGIVGCGVIADWHARSIQELPNACLLGVTDLNQNNRDSFAGKYGVKAYERLEDLLHSEVDVVCICTPSGLHAQLAVSAISSGKHVVVEKPLAITKGELEEIKEACEKNKVKVSTISQLRFTDAVVQMKKALEENRLGKLVLSDLSMKFYRSQEYYDTGGWRGTWKMDGGGALMNQGIHGVDLLQYLCGVPKSVTAHIRTLTRKIEVEDTAVAILEFENGALGQITATTSVYPGSERVLEINGDQGTIQMTGDTLTKWALQDSEENLVEAKKTENNTSSNPTNFSIAGHKKQLEDMVTAILNDRKPAIDHLEASKPVELILAIYESSKTGKTVYLK